MRSGELRHYITIQSRTDTRGSAGQVTPKWADTKTAWAKIESPRGIEGVEAAKLEGKITHHVTIRYQSGITPAMRIKWGSRYMEIKSAIDWQGRNKWVHIVAVEDVS